MAGIEAALQARMRISIIHSCSNCTLHPESRMMRHQACSSLGLLASMPVGVELLLLGASDIAAAYSSSCHTSAYELRQVQAFIAGCTGRQTLSC